MPSLCTSFGSILRPRRASASTSASTSAEPDRPRADGEPQQESPLDDSPVSSVPYQPLSISFPPTEPHETPGVQLELGEASWIDAVGDTSTAQELESPPLSTSAPVAPALGLAFVTSPVILDDPQDSQLPPSTLYTLPTNPPLRQRGASVSSAGSFTSYSFVSTSPSSPRSIRPPSPLARRISTRLDQAGRRMLVRRSSTRSPPMSGSSESSDPPAQKTKRMKKVYGVGSGESTEEEEEEGWVARPRVTGSGSKQRSSSSPAVHLLDPLICELDFLPTLSHSEPSPSRHPPTPRRNSAPDGRPFHLHQPIQPYFQPLPSPPASARSFSFVMSPIRWGSPSPTTSPSSSAIDLRDPSSPPSPSPRRRVLSSASLFTSSLESSSTSEEPSFVVDRSSLTRKRTDRRPPLMMTEIGVEQQQGVRRTLTITNPDIDS